jgi:hypothetical protein
MVDILTFDHCTPSGERKHSGEVLGFCSFSPGEEGRDESILNTPPHLSPEGRGSKAVKFRGFYPSTIKLPR